MIEYYLKDLTNAPMILLRDSTLPVEGRFVCLNGRYLRVLSLLHNPMTSGETNRLPLPIVIVDYASDPLEVARNQAVNNLFFD